MQLLHSREHLQAFLQFADHIQAVTAEEHQLLSKSAVPGAQPGLQHEAAADVSTTYHAHFQHEMHRSWQCTA